MILMDPDGWLCLECYDVSLCLIFETLCIRLLYVMSLIKILYVLWIGAQYGKQSFWLYAIPFQIVSSFYMTKWILGLRLLSKSSDGRCAITVNPVSVMFAHNKLDIMSSAVTQVHYTPLTNLCVCSTDNGDLLFLSPRELHYERPLGKQFGGLRRFLTTMDVKTLNGDPLVRIDKNSTSELPNDWNMYEKNYKYKYGLVFGSIFPVSENFVLYPPHILKKKRSM